MKIIDNLRCDEPTGVQGYFASRRDCIGYTPGTDAERLSFTEFVDLCLAHVAEGDREEPGGYFDLFGFKDNLRMQIDDESAQTRRRSKTGSSSGGSPSPSQSPTIST